jgi:hypothetical protein
MEKFDGIFDLPVLEDPCQVFLILTPDANPGNQGLISERMWQLTESFAMGTKRHYVSEL